MSKIRRGTTGLIRLILEKMTPVVERGFRYPDQTGLQRLNYISINGHVFFVG